MEKSVNLFSDFKIDSSSNYLSAIIGGCGSGKTILLSKFLIEHAKNKIDCAFISSELNEESIKKTILREISKHKGFEFDNCGEIAIKSTLIGRFNTQDIYDFILKKKCKVLFLDGIDFLNHHEGKFEKIFKRKILIEKTKEIKYTLKQYTTRQRLNFVLENLRKISNKLNCTIYFTANANRNYSGDMQFVDSNLNIHMTDLCFYLKSILETRDFGKFTANVVKNRFGEDGKEYKFKY